MLIADILPGEPFFRVSGTKYMVRAEYLRMFDEVVAIIKSESENGREPLVGILGQPGIGVSNLFLQIFLFMWRQIGKSVWVKYALRRCLGDKIEVAFIKGKIIWIFSDTGIKGYNRMLPRNPNGVWCFIDTDDRIGMEKASAVAGRESGFCPVFVSSPDPAQWRSLEHQRLVSKIIMNPWLKLGELQYA